VTFDFQQCDIPNPLAQLIYEWADNSEVDNLFGVGMEIAAPPFPQDIQDDQAVHNDQKVNMVPIAAPHVS
jgi:hypothetical protein